MTGLSEKEGRLRVAVASSSLEDLRRRLRMTAILRKDQHDQVSNSGQKAMTRLQTTFARFKEKELESVERYGAEETDVIYRSVGQRNVW